MLQLIVLDIPFQLHIAVVSFMGVLAAVANSSITNART